MVSLDRSWNGEMADACVSVVCDNSPVIVVYSVATHRVHTCAAWTTSYDNSPLSTSLSACGDDCSLSDIRHVVPLRKELQLKSLINSSC